MPEISIAGIARRRNCAQAGGLHDRRDYPELWIAETPGLVCRSANAPVMILLDRVGFVHGVMNTDNMSILGLTIDYGRTLDRQFRSDWT